MTESNDEQLEQLEQPSQDVGEQTSSKTTSSASSEGKRFAAYDTRYERFVGKPQDSKSKAKAEAKAFGVDAGALEVREV